ncbi:hypothetical protein P7K49_031297, partial [Saguinus oedipus]
RPGQVQGLRKSLARIPNQNSSGDGALGLGGLPCRVRPVLSLPSFWALVRYEGEVSSPRTSLTTWPPGGAAAGHIISFPAKGPRPFARAVPAAAGEVPGKEVDALTLLTILYTDRGFTFQEAAPSVLSQNLSEEG